MLYKEEQLCVVERITFAFSFGISILIIPATILFILRSSLTAVVMLTIGVTTILLVFCLLQRWRVRHKCEEKYQKTVHYRPWSAENGSGLEFISLSVALAIFTLAFLYIAITQSGINIRWTDGAKYFSYISSFVKKDSLDVNVLHPQIDSRIGMSTWLVIIALIGKVSQTPTVEMYYLYLMPVLIVISLLSHYTWYKTLFNRINMALCTMLVWLVHLTASLGLDLRVNQGEGNALIWRLNEDKYFATWVLLPILLTLVWRYLSTQRLNDLVGFALVSTATTIAHPIGYIFQWLLIGSFVLIKVIVHAVALGWRNIKSVVLAPVGWSVLFRSHIANMHVIKYLAIFAILLCLMVYPWLQRQMVISGGSKTFDLEEAVEGADVVIERLSYRHLIMFSLKWYMVSPTLVMQPMIPIALVLTPVLLKYIAKERSAQFLFASMCFPLIAIYNPATAVVLGKLMSAGQLWRIRWVLPIAPVIGFVLYQAIDYLRKRWDASAWVLSSVIRSLLPLIAVFMLAVVHSNNMREGIQWMEKEHQRVDVVFISAELRDVLERVDHYCDDDDFMRKVVVMAPKYPGRSLPIFSLCGRPIAPFALGIDLLAEGYISRFFGQREINDVVLQILDMYKVEYIVNSNDYPIPLRDAPSIFQPLYRNARYSLYRVVPNIKSNPAVRADLLMLSGNFEQAIREYRSLIALNPDNPWFYLGLGRAYQSLGQMDDALVNYSRFSELVSDDVAIEYLSNVMNIAPNFVTAYLANGRFFRSPMSPNVVYDLLVNFDEVYGTLNSLDVRRTAFVVDQSPKGVIFHHPPGRIDFQLPTPPNAALQFALSLAPNVWQPGKGDGVQFDIYLDNGSVRQNIFSRYIDPKNIPEHRKWHDYEIDLSPWAGQTVTITFETGCGPNNNCDYDWAGWGEPRIVQPVAYSFLEHISTAEKATQGFGEVRVLTQTINYEPRPLLFQHPTSQVAYSLTLPLQSMLHFGYGMAPDVWSPEKGDGVEYNIYVQRSDEPYKLYRVFHRYIDPKNNPDDRRWFDERVDLSRFGGQEVKVIFEALPGPAGNADYDWGGWSAPVLVDNTPPGEGMAGSTVTFGNTP
ncbi:MAG: tetratricopeptide repeat protein [Candidatus Methanomethylicaceae archaeon]